MGSFVRFHFSLFIRNKAKGLPLVGEQHDPQEADPLDSSRTPYRLPRINANDASPREDEEEDGLYRVWSRHGYEVYNKRFNSQNISLVCFIHVHCLQFDWFQTDNLCTIKFFCAALQTTSHLCTVVLLNLVKSNCILPKILIKLTSESTVSTKLFTKAPWLQTQTGNDHPDLRATWCTQKAKPLISTTICAGPLTLTLTLPQSNVNGNLFELTLTYDTQCGSYMAAEAYYLKKASAVFF